MRIPYLLPTSLSRHGISFGPIPSEGAEVIGKCAESRVLRLSRDDAGCALRATCSPS